MKALDGVWAGKMDFGNGPMDISVEYRVVAGTPMEMMSMYHDNDGKLAMTHYCMLHNQPIMILESADESSISLDFDEGCGIDASTESHMHALTVTFNDDDTITQSWTALEGGEATENHPYTLTRVEEG
jgi:hypothetical protein